MFGLEYFIVFVKVCFNVAFSIVTAIPMYFSWNCIAPKYLSTYLPIIFLQIPFWHIVAFFLVCTFLGEQIEKLTPKIVSISQTNTNSK